MKIFRLIILCLLFGAALRISQAQEVSTSGNIAVALQKPAPAKTGDAYHLETTLGYRQPLNGDYDWWLPATIAFGKMMNDHLALDAAFGGGVIQLKPGSAADARGHQPFFLELGIVLRYHFAARETPLKPYVTAGASVLWMSWEYRSPVDSPNFGLITRDYLEGVDGYAGLGLSLRLRQHLNCFVEADAGGIGFLSTTHSGVHNDLFNNFGYVGVRGGFNLTF